MNEYKIVFECSDGYSGEETVMAVNRIMAFEIFEEFGYEDIVSVNCYCITDDENNAAE